ncbi:MAG: DNA replication/repair protein RecF [Bacteroidota bacterium]
MHLQNLFLSNFKNYRNAELQFTDKINCFVGDNGVGKTNLLDAIYYLSFCKSFFNQSDSQNILHDEDFFLVKGTFSREEMTDDTVSCLQKRGQRKQFRINKKEYERLSEHIGLFPSVMVSPADTELIYGGSDERRKFMDSVISQFDRIYLDDLIAYNKALFQRNRLLKLFGSGMPFDNDALDIWDVQLANLGSRIFEKRTAFIQGFTPVFDRLFSKISQDREGVTLEYQSQLSEEKPDVLLRNSISRDCAAQFTTCGIHKDDLQFNLGGLPIRKFGSQGQQKTFTIAIRLAQFEYIRTIKDFKPLLLFDDIFDKLDEHRVRQLLDLVSEHSFGQVFISDTHPERIINTIKSIEAETKVFKIHDGLVTEILNGNE